MKHGLPRRLQPALEILTTLSTLFTGARFGGSAVQGEGWVLSQSELQEIPVPDPCRRSQNLAGWATRMSASNCSGIFSCPRSVDTADNFLHSKPPDI